MKVKGLSRFAIESVLRSGRALTSRDPDPAHPSPLPMFEGIVHNGLEHQAVPNLGGSPEVKHLNGLQCRVGTTQPAGGGQRLGIGEMPLVL